MDKQKHLASREICPILQLYTIVKFKLSQFDMNNDWWEIYAKCGKKIIIFYHPCYASNVRTHSLSKTHIKFI